MIGIESYMLLMLLASMGAGVLGALVGIGGGILITPILTLGFGVPVQYAIGASIIAVIGTSSGAASAFLKDRISNFNIGTFLNVGTTIGAVLGAVMSIYLIGSGMKWAIYVVFGAVLIGSAYDMYRKLRRERKLSSANVNVASNRFGDLLELKGAYYDSYLKQQVPYEATHVPQSLCMMFCAGLLSGLLGIGSGVLNGLGMDMLMRLPFKVSATTSNFMIGVTAAASAAIFFLNGYVNLLIVGPVAVGVIGGAFLGAKFVGRSKPMYLRLVFMLVLIVTGINMLQKGLILV